MIVLSADCVSTRPTIGNFLNARLSEAIDAAERAYSLADNAWDQIQFRGDLAAIAAIAGDADRAIELIREELALPGWVTRGWLKIEYRYDNLRDDPRFQEIVETK